MIVILFGGCSLFDRKIAITVNHIESYNLPVDVANYIDTDEGKFIVPTKYTDALMHVGVKAKVVVSMRDTVTDIIKIY